MRVAQFEGHGLSGIGSGRDGVVFSMPSVSIRGRRVPHVSAEPRLKSPQGPHSTLSAFFSLPWGTIGILLP